jgi:hypothetical protein
MFVIYFSENRNSDYTVITVMMMMMMMVMMIIKSVLVVPFGCTTCYLSGLNFVICHILHYRSGDYEK